MASIALQTTEQDAGGDAPRLIIRDRIVPLSRLPQSARDAIVQLEEGIELATGVSNARHLIAVTDGAVASVQPIDGPIQVPASEEPLHLLMLAKTEAGGRRVASAAALSPGFIASDEELIVTSKPQLVAQLLAAGGFEVTPLTLYLSTAQPVDAPSGTDYLAVIRLDEAALLLAGAQYDVSALLQYIVTTNWQSPERAPHPAFVPTFGAALAGWSDVWS